ncbi:hypothetical protein Ade02nite_48290 [Paractinoplanes deccanensis]|uniref:Uncharacterized protein n=1 Tax=Paractinoplanes deccanensis TaxID=113561 RepID=A0ABQ3Y883_9ACTN|nr:hypothetical protein Ade02nite_48290 [Actinoplanes deccanensis]
MPDKDKFGNHTHDRNPIRARPIPRPRPHRPPELRAGRRVERMGSAALGVAGAAGSAGGQERRSGRRRAQGVWGSGVRKLSR